jgi:nucleotide-binding universal stress UspA family protein
MSPIRDILHPTDFSGRARHAHDVARSLARDLGARLHVVHVVQETHVVEEPVTVFEPSSLDMPGAGGGGERQGYHEALKDHLRELHPTGPGVRVETYLREGDPAEEILRLADDVGADLIVIGTHGRRGLARAVLGSVAESVMRRARCPVLTVRSDGRGGEPSVESTATARRPTEGTLIHPTRIGEEDLP